MAKKEVEIPLLGCHTVTVYVVFFTCSILCQF